MRFLVQLTDQSFRLSGIYLFPHAQNRYRKLHNHSFTFLLLLLLSGILTEAIFPRDGNRYSLLPVTYALCCVYALAKRFILISKTKKTRQLLIALQNTFRYSPHLKTEDGYLNDETLQFIYRVFTCLLSLLFFSAYASPFSSIFLGRPLNYSMIMYPIYIPWKVETFNMFLVTWLVEALLVCPALIGIYSSTAFLVFMTTAFKKEFHRICGAVNRIESRINRTQTEYKTWKTPANYHYFGPERTSHQEIIYFLNLRECAIHYQEIIRNFEIFSNWYNDFFAIELIESTTTICLLLYCSLKLNDLTLFMNLAALCFTVVTGLFFRCLIGELFTEMNEKLTSKLYDIKWYDQPRRITKSYYIFTEQTKRQCKLYAFNYFSASYTTFMQVSRISYSFFNVMFQEIKS